MQPALADIVHTVVTYALDLRRRLDQGDELDLLEEQAVLCEMLRSDRESSGIKDFGPAPKADHSASESSGNLEEFLGVRYALACWLDELFVVESPWSKQWNERKIEATLYGSNDRAWKYWRQAELARQLSTTDALEVFFLCAMLGFRGELRESPQRFQDWARATRSRIASDPSRKWAAVPELQPPSFVPPRRGRLRLRRTVLICGAVLLLLVPLATFGIITRLG